MKGFENDQKTQPIFLSTTTHIVRTEDQVGSRDHSLEQRGKEKEENESDFQRDRSSIKV